VLIEACLPKRRILEIYLNIAEFGYGTTARGRRGALFPQIRRRPDAQRLRRAGRGPAQSAAALGRRAIRLRAAAARLDPRTDASARGAEMLGEIDANPSWRR